MADLPRWINSSKVETPAMFMAYVQWLGKELQKADPETYPEDKPVIVPEEKHHLPTVIHRSDYVTSLKANEKLCTASECERCQSGRGGYQFRWYSALWYEGYLKGRQREDRWTLGDPEDG
ncbi:unnamed protein product [Symbiodinium natans]|uniref:Uncharacterized protein n=1 Tax=Symbiodinium natans TaxID=878477 RepID=A0A812JMT0_9DINO|nr:unnamed protein product [Symbiodinium natans]